MAYLAGFGNVVYDNTYGVVYEGNIIYKNSLTLNFFFSTIAYTSVCMVLQFFKMEAQLPLPHPSQPTAYQNGAGKGKCKKNSTIDSAHRALQSEYLIMRFGGLFEGRVR